MHTKMGVCSSGERSLFMLAFRHGKLVQEARTSLIIDCLPVFDKPSNGVPERIETVVPSSLLDLAEAGSSP